MLMKQVLFCACCGYVTRDLDQTLQLRRPCLAEDRLRKPHCALSCSLSHRKRLVLRQRQRFGKTFGKVFAS